MAKIDCFIKALLFIFCILPFSYSDEHDILIINSECKHKVRQCPGGNLTQGNKEENVKPVNQFSSLNSSSILQVNIKSTIKEDKDPPGRANFDHSFDRTFCRACQEKPCVLKQFIISRSAFDIDTVHGVCFVRYCENSQVVRLACEHFFCVPCLKGYVDMCSVNRGRLKSLGVKCPHYQCAEKVDSAFIIFASGEDVLKSINRTIESIESMRAKEPDSERLQLTKAMLEAEIPISMCPTCYNICIREGGDCHNTFCESCCKNYCQDCYKPFIDKYKHKKNGLCEPNSNAVKVLVATTIQKLIERHAYDKPTFSELET